MVYLIRHTTPAIESGVCYGRSDIALADTAPREIAAVLEVIPDIAIVYSSPAQRCLHLAQAVTAAQGIGHQIDPRLQEMDFGAWEGRRWDDIPASEIARWDAQLWEHPPGGGESLRDLWQRVAGFSDEVLSPFAEAADRHALVVSHHGPLRVLHCLGSGLTHTQLFEAAFGFGASGLRRWVPVHPTATA
jgi:alpha-ribazole phosphatase